jgi:hypothetical protein
MQEYVYICASDQMPAHVYKVGETHRQSPERRARQFTGVDRRVHWHVVRAFPTPDARYTEKLVHQRLIAQGAQHLPRSELFCAALEYIVRIVEQSVAVTPVPPARSKATPHAYVSAAAQEPSAWQQALAMPLDYRGEAGLTLAHAMARAARGNDTLRRRLALGGIELVYPDERTPHFRIHALPGSALGRWLAAQALAWSDLQVPAGGSRKLRCVSCNPEAA